MENARNEYYKYLRNKILITDVCRKLNIALHPVGNDFVCQCMHHSDEHPSMHIYTDSNRYYCFQCGENGDVLSFLKERLSCNTKECLSWIEGQYPEVLSEKPPCLEGASLPTGYDVAWNCYRDMTAEEKRGLAIFAGERGYNLDFLIRAEVFFAAGRKLKNSLEGEDVFLEEKNVLEDLKLFQKVKNTDRDIRFGRYEDFFRRDRVIITLRSSQGNIVGFAGRSVREDDKPKYLFTKELPKRKILYRLHRVQEGAEKRKAKETEELYLVEGIFDALRLEQNGKSAVAVLGSYLQREQSQAVAEYVAGSSHAVKICVFMDNDEAGLEGNYKTIQNLWKHSVLRRTNIAVYVTAGEKKDPDECYKGLGAEETPDVKSYSVPEYLFRYFLRSEGRSLTELDVKTEYKARSVEGRISMLHEIENLLTKEEWQEVFGWHSAVHASELDGEEESGDEAYAYGKLQSYVRGIGGVQAYFGDEAKQYLYRMQTALQIARASYHREPISLDEESWNRIALGADAFFPYFYSRLEELKSFAEIPLITAWEPKKKDEQRRKALYLHEELLLQQYVLNELLTRGTDAQYESFIPAVRHQEGKGAYLTGYGYQGAIDEVVSFAYQVEMPAVSGTVPIEHGMYRPFYECWKDYIHYVQEGIRALKGNVVYRVKLDIRGFYDHIRKYVVRNAVYEPVRQALLKDSEKFKCFGNRAGNADQCAKNLVDWILQTLYADRYYDAKDGSLQKKEDPDCGIPQGPNLSAYIANAALFEVDRQVYQIVKYANSACEKGRIAARYCRYVDDMILIASDPSLLLSMKHTITSILYEMGLELSPKTDAEDGITKEEAMEWTVDARGGLGVSVAFDMADDTLDSVVEESGEYDMVSRRDALNALQSALRPMLYEGTDMAVDAGRFLDLVFKMDEIRIGDIVRFSEFMLYQAAKADGGLFLEFQKLWDKGMQDCPAESMLWTDGISVYVFLEGCMRILVRQRAAAQARLRDFWKSTVDKIREAFQAEDVIRAVKDAVCHTELMQKNAWATQLKLLKIASLAECEMKWNWEGEENEYSLRWKWCVGKEQKIKKLNIVNDDLCQIFHYAMAGYGKAKQKSEIKEINSQLQEYGARLKVGPESNILMECIQIWLDEVGEKKHTDNMASVALRVALNVLKPKMRAEVIGGVSAFSEYLFSLGDGKAVLPVFPGVNYPGIMAYRLEPGCHALKAERYDFCSEEKAVAAGVTWRSCQGKVEGSQAMHFEASLKQEQKQYISLEEYMKEEGGPDPLTVLEKVAGAYQKLADHILSVSQENPNEKLILSKKNVILIWDPEKKEVDDVMLGISYLVPKDVSNDAVAVEKAAGRFLLQGVNADGAAFWIAGILLADAGNVDRIQLEQSSKEEEYRQHAEMLTYSARRLQGHYLHHGAKNKSEHSYRSAVLRTIEQIKGYLKEGVRRDVYLENARIENDFIRNRLEKKRYQFSDVFLELAIWAKNHLRFGFLPLIRLLESEGAAGAAQYEFERRVPRLYCCLADRIHALCSQETADLLGILALSAGLFSDAVLMNLRMQVLERIRDLTEAQREGFLKEGSCPPFAALGLEENTALTVQGEWKDVWERLLHRENDRSIRFVTHLGWVMMLAKLCEAEKLTGHILKENNEGQEGVKEHLTGLADLLAWKETEEKETKKKDARAFPYDGLGNFYEAWEAGRVVEMISHLNKLDELAGINVLTVKDADYRQRRLGADVVIDYSGGQLRETPYFLTFGKLRQEYENVERCVDDRRLRLFTASVRHKKVLGVSAIVEPFGDLLQGWEKQEGAAQGQQEMADAPAKAAPDFMRDAEGKSGHEESAGRNAAGSGPKDPGGPAGPADHGQINSNHGGEGLPLSGIYPRQREAWEKRKKEFANFDRIAILQFQIDDSYYHPLMEACPVLEKERLKKEKKEQREGTYGKKRSCAEFRRREILRHAMEACSCFGVEILLLPEYSVRPETVEWMCRLISRNKYSFSVWAGTFRIPPHYRFDKAYWKRMGLEEGETDQTETYLNSSAYWNAAMLPVIEVDRGNEEEGTSKKVRILAEKFKKYPSLTLHEDINPVPAGKGNFMPLMKKMHGKEILRDARGDVTEIICAEMFAVSAICNYPSFFNESFKAYNKYVSTNKEKKEEYKKEMLQDILDFGAYTAIYQEKSRYSRTPILLLPACTTRTADYYVWGQGDYLAAGVKTALCNSVGKATNGGSCFIGQDSWDNSKLNDDENLADTTIYHGLKPGMYQQSSCERDRGALGKREQALLIYDVNPSTEKTKPNAESMLESLSIVAHIPILEERKEPQKCRECSQKYISKRKFDQSVRSDMDTLIRHCNEQSRKTTMEEEKAEEMGDCLERMGKACHSAWLKRRGEYYKKFHILRPQPWVPPTLVDWMHITIDYGAFMESKDGQEQCWIQAPSAGSFELNGVKVER